MVAVYKIISVLEECANIESGESCTTSLNSVFGMSGLSKLTYAEHIRKLRNILVHSPLDYAGAYTLLNKCKSDLKRVLKLCSSRTGMYSGEDLEDCVVILLKFLKENK